MIIETPIYAKSKTLGAAIIRLAHKLEGEKHYILAKQILKSGTSVGANIREAYRAQSQPDFISKMNIALKEAEETEYWLELILETKLIDTKTFSVYYDGTEEIIKMLVSIINTTKKRQNNK